ncbi:MAG TPA: nicotinate-nucleotide--dimethylbenzimidazole phosphoribosyltransferase [Thermoanaerobaculia bacterium]
MTEITLAAARAALEGKLKPPGSLGRLEDWAAQLAVLQRTLEPRVERGRVLVFAADHGVAAEGVSAYPASVTAGLMRVSAAGTTGIGVLGRSLGVEVEVVDVGVDEDFDGLAGIVHAKVRRGSRNLAAEPALADGELEAALAVGREAAGRAIADGVAAVALGEMGIGNSTAAAALLSALTGVGPERTAGRGSGVDDATLMHKRGVVARALALHRDRLADPRAALAALGGLELAAIAGAALAAAGARRAVVVDGFISTVAVLAAVRIEPAIRPALFFAHRSAEAGHAIALEALAAEPLLDLGLRLGEGTGAALGLRLLAAAADVLREMAELAAAAPAGEAGTGEGVSLDRAAAVEERPVE